ncbi:spore germination protein [Clostridia bacterium]|nr:spore germination protein [Clostridia bacterium]
MINYITTQFGGASDLSRREIDGGTLLYIDGLAGNFYVAAFESGVPRRADKVTDNPGSAIEELLMGNVVIVRGKTAEVYDCKAFPTRSVSEPSGENVVKGAKDAFVESLRVNTALVRRKIKNPKLRFASVTVGARSSTPVAVVWLDGVTSSATVDEILRRLNAITSDALLTASQLEEQIADNKLTPFPQLVCTERSDKFCAGLVAGRAGILIDGLPLSYLAPCAFGEFMRAPEDFSQNYLSASLITVLRYAALFLSLALPAIYLSLVCFHQEMLPSALALSIIEAKKDVPFNSLIEVFGMLIALETLLEAGLRLPKPIGQTVSLVGALVVGQAAVEAKFVSPAVVIIIAMTGIAGFTAPNQDMSAAIRLFRFALTALAALWGLFGVALGLILIVYHLAGMKSFGTDYLAPSHILRPPLPPKRRKK